MMPKSSMRSPTRVPLFPRSGLSSPTRSASPVPLGPNRPPRGGIPGAGRVALALLLLASGNLGCGGKGDEAPPEADAPAPLAGLEVRAKLLDQVHLADIDQRGLFIDLGTPAQAKYTAGDWGSGWGKQGRDGDGADAAAWARVGQRGKLWFHLDGPSDLTAVLRLRSKGTGALTPYVNGTAVQSVFFDEGGGWQEVTMSLPAVETQAGDNQLLLVFGDTTVVDGEPTAAEVDWLRVARGAGAGDDGFEPPRFARLVDEVTVAGEARRALTLPRPVSVAWHVSVPPGGKLGTSVAGLGSATASGSVEVVVTPEGGTGKTVASTAVSAGWQDLVADLSELGGQVVRLELRATPAEGGGGRIAFGEPAIWAALAGPTDAVSDRKPKHIVIVLTDTLRASKLKIYNPDSRVISLVIDRIAEEGVVFEQAQSPAPWTKPSVASILTGLHPMTHGAKTQAAVVPDSARFLGEHLKSMGWSTAAFIGNGYVSDKFGFDQGWDRYRNFIREGADTDAPNIYREAGDWAEQHKDDKFLLYVHTIDPHVPYDPPQEDLERYDPRPNYDGIVKPRSTGDLLAKAKKNPPLVVFSESDKRRLEALHDGEITQHDVEMGKFIDRLVRLGIWDDTLFVFVSDHGEEFEEHGSWGHGHSVYQELLQVPLVMRFRGGIPAGVRVPSSVSTMDISPTVLEVAGLAPLPNAEGRSLVPLFRGGRFDVPAVAFSEWGDNRRVAVAGPWKFILRGNLTTAMFDLSADPGEQNQLDVTDFPIAGRYTRILQGQFLGASDRANWFASEQGEGQRLVGEGQETQMDAATCEQLKALGYVDAETDCSALDG